MEETTLLTADIDPFVAAKSYRLVGTSTVTQQNSTHQDSESRLAAATHAPSEKQNSCLKYHFLLHVIVCYKSGLTYKPEGRGLVFQKDKGGLQSSARTHSNCFRKTVMSERGGYPTTSSWKEPMKPTRTHPTGSVL